MSEQWLPSASDQELSESQRFDSEKYALEVECDDLRRESGQLRAALVAAEAERDRYKRDWQAKSEEIERVYADWTADMDEMRARLDAATGVVEAAVGYERALLGPVEPKTKAVAAHWLGVHDARQKLIDVVRAYRERDGGEKEGEG